MLFRVNMFDNKRGVKKEEDQISRRISIVPHVNSYLKKANSRCFKKNYLAKIKWRIYFDSFHLKFLRIILIVQ